jgi:hypothetical protein
VGAGGRGGFEKEGVKGGQGKYQERGKGAMQGSEVLGEGVGKTVAGVGGRDAAKISGME